MAYRRFHRSKPTVRTITVKYAGKCIGCGCVIPVGAIADYYPVGTIAGVNTPQIAHLKALTGDSKSCFVASKQQSRDFVDEQYEQDCKDRCGL